MQSACVLIERGRDSRNGSTDPRPWADAVRRCHLQAQENQTSSTLTLAFQPPGLDKNKFFCCLNHPVGGILLRQP